MSFQVVAVVGASCFLCRHNIMGCNLFPVLETKKLCSISQVGQLCINYQVHIPLFSFLFGQLYVGGLPLILFVWVSLYRWQISYSAAVDLGYKPLGMECSSLQSPGEPLRKCGTDKTNEKEVYQKNEWFGYLMRFRNDSIFILSIICLQLPFELAYAHLYEVIGSNIMK